MPPAIPMLDLVRLHAPLKTAFTEVLSAALDSGQFIGGRSVALFETALADYVDATFAVGVSSGTDALLATMMALGVRPGDEVITTPYTFFATAGSIARLGGRPVFVDIDPHHFNIDPDRVAAAVGPHTVGILPVHLFGQSADMAPILAIAKDKGLWVLEDCAQSIGATYHGTPTGTLGEAGTVSFFPAKNLGALGDSGAVVTRSGDLADRIRAMRQHGAVTRYEHCRIGGNFRLDALQAAFLSVKLSHLPEWEQGRRQVAARYAERLADVEAIALPGEGDGNRHVFNQYVIRTPHRDRLREALTAAGIASAVYYPTPLHLQPCFASLGYRKGAFPESEAAALESLALPIDPLLDPVSQERIVRAIRAALGARLQKG